MRTGVIRWFSDHRGYGFIDLDDENRGEPLYVHHTAILGRGYRSLRAGQTVRFEVRRDGSLRQAIDVEVV
ncbi:MAG TPA: cold shock domain-containing protein [Candidatus Krumholzibacteria bacterium]|jgi:CspA family cold shock protein|nr:cold shock domain-containing protein [Candidatus Krumholzibacteria bacterium]